MQSLPPDLQNDILSFVEVFNDVCSLALVSKDMRSLAARKRRMMVEDRQLRVQCGRCLRSFRAPGLTLEDRHERRPLHVPGWTWFCPTPRCPGRNEVSRAYHDVVERPGWHIPHRRMDIVQVGQESDFVLVPHPFCGI